MTLWCYSQKAKRALRKLDSMFSSLVNSSPGFGAIRQTGQAKKKSKLSWQLHATNTATKKSKKSERTIAEMKCMLTIYDTLLFY